MQDILDLSKDSPVLDLAKAAPSLRTLRARMTWDAHPVHGASLTEGFDLDIFSFVLSAQEKIGSGSDVVFYNNKVYAGGAIVLPEDNRAGGEEHCDYTLDEIPSDRAMIDIYVGVFDASLRKQHFGMISNAKLHLETKVGGTYDESYKALQVYSISEYTGKTMLHAGRLTRATSGYWSFSPIGAAAVATSNDVARAYV